MFIYIKFSIVFVGTKTMSKYLIHIIFVFRKVRKLEQLNNIRFETLKGEV